MLEAKQFMKSKWLTTLLTEVQIKIVGIPTVFCDNISTTHIGQNPVFCNRMKRVKIKVQHLPAAKQVADLLTKPLQQTTFNSHFNMLDRSAQYLHLTISRVNHP